MVVGDNRLRAYHLFGANGEFERRVGWAPDGGMLVLTGFMPDPKSAALFSAVGSQFRSVAFTGDSKSHTTRPVERVVLAGAVATKDTVAEGWLPEDAHLWQVGPPVAFGPLMLMGVLPDGSVAFSDSTAYSIKIARPGADVWRIMRRPLRPIPVTRRMISAEKDRLRERIPGGDPTLRQDEKERIDNLPFSVDRRSGTFSVVPISVVHKGIMRHPTSRATPSRF